MTTGGDAMSGLKWVPWTQWSRGGMVGAGQMTLKQVQENLQRFERKARKSCPRLEQTMFFTA